MRWSARWASWGCVLLVSLGLRPAVGRLCNDLGWLSLTRALIAEEPASRAQTYFGQAVAAGVGTRALLGLGVAHATQLAESEALEAWSSGHIDPEVLDSLGRQAWSRGNLDMALLFFRSAARLGDGAVGSYLAGSLCQAQRLEPALVSLTNQEYCSAYFAAQDGNLLVNGEFEGGLAGWQPHAFPRDETQALVYVQEAGGNDGACMVLTGLRLGRHGGVYQRVPLEPGTKVRFSGEFMTENVTRMESWLLYVEWRESDTGKIQGNHAFTADAQMDWSFLEREFMLPYGSEPWVQFYPVLLIGQGSVVVDAVRIEVLEDQ